MGTKSKVGNKEYIHLRIGREGSESYSALAKYHSNWGILLSGASKEVRKTVEGAFKRVEGKHLTKPVYEREVLKLLAEQTAPLGRKEIVTKLSERLAGEFSKADLERTSKGKRLRWEKYARFAVSGLAIQKLIAARTKNQWVITEEGRIAAKDLG